MKHNGKEHRQNEIAFWSVYAGLLVVTLLLRSFAIEARPLHSDEGVNFHFLEKIRSTGLYEYSHENYHGPAYFWLEYPAYLFFGESVFALRFLSILSGLLLPVLLLRVRKQAGNAFVLLATLFLALSPSLVFFSRYSIHEPFFIFSCLWFTLELYKFVTTGSLAAIYLGAIALALMVSTKETFIIALPTIAIPALLVSLLSSGGARALLASVRSITPHIAFAIILGTTLVTGFYSSGVQSFRGIRELLLSIPQWVGRGASTDVGHFKSFGYYATSVLFPTEPWLLFSLPIGCIALAFALYLLCSRKLINTPLSSLLVYFSFWGLLSFLLYSAIPYKTVWLVINITLPLILTLAAALAALLPWRRAAKPTVCATALLLALFMGANTFYFNFPPVDLPYLRNAQPYGPSNPFSYVHTSPGFLELVQDIQDYWTKKPDARVLIGVDAYWPLPYYLRNKKDQTAYFVPKNTASYLHQYDIIIVERRGRPDFGWYRKYYRLSDVEEADAYFKPLPPEGSNLMR